MKYSTLTDIEKKKIIKQKYINNNESFADIAKSLDTYPNKIRRDAIKFDIPIRDKSEAQKNAIQRGVHKHPTKGTKRSEKTKAKIGKSVLNSWDSMSDKKIQERKDKSKQRWLSMSDDEKQLIIQAANQGVRNSSKTGSKLEKFILKKLISHGYNVDFHKEQMLSNTKLQVDLFLPKLNIAIEIDGPSHFLPVWGQDALNRNIKYDNKKTGLLMGKGCVLVRIKQLRDYSPTRGSLVFDKLLDIIKGIEAKFPPADQRLLEIEDN